MGRLRNAFIYGVLFLVAVGCSKNDSNVTRDQIAPSSPTPSVPADAVTYDIPLKLSAAAEKLPEGTKDLLEKISQKKPVSFAKITELMVSTQVDRYNKANPKSKVSYAEMQELVGKLVESQKNIENIHDAKVAYEAKLAEVFGKKIRYNKEATTLPVLLKSQEMQCSTGTLLQQVIWRSHAHFNEKNSVYIFEKGHVLPGYMEKEEGEWNLVGIETVKGGKAKRNFGRVSKLKQPLVLVDAELAAVIDIAMGYLSYPDEVALSAREFTGKKYGFDWRKFSPDPTHYKNKSEEGPNSSVFGFGVAYTPAGSLDRGNADELSGETMGIVQTGKVAREDQLAGKNQESDFTFTMITIQAERFGGKEYAISLMRKGQVPEILRLPFASYFGENASFEPAEMLPLTIVDEYQGEKMTSLTDEEFRITVKTKLGQWATIGWSLRSSAGLPINPSVIAGSFLGADRSKW